MIKLVPMIRQFLLESDDSNVDVIFENSKVIVVSPKTWESACKYGVNTKWCDIGHLKKHWDHYVSGGMKIYFIIPKHDGRRKFSVIVSPTGEVREAYNELDWKMNKHQLTNILGKYRLSPEKTFLPSHQPTV